MTVAVVTVMLKPGVLDPQGQAIGQALQHLGYDEVEAVRAGKVIELELGDGAPEALRARADAMARRLLANTVIETWSVELR